MPGLVSIQEFEVTLLFLKRLHHATLLPAETWLAPSKVKDTEVVQAAGYIFGLPSFAHIREFEQQHTRLVESHQTPSSPSQHAPAAVESQHSNADELCRLVFTQLTDTFAWTHNLADEEPPGSLPLGNLVVFWGETLSRVYNCTYKCHPQRTVARNVNPRQNQSTDITLVLVAMDADGER